jgi:eukaryotic-like serine/threonine-protein kinase
MGERVDARTDIYSVGVTLYQLLTGRVPIDGSGEYAIASGHLKAVPADPVTINPNIPAGLSAIVMKSLAKAPVDRFQSAEEFLEALDSLQSDDTTTMLPTPFSPRDTSGFESKKVDLQPTASHPTKTLSNTTVLVAVTQELAQHIGPIAKVVVNRAAKQAATLDDLYALLSTEIESESARRSFLATRQKYSLKN